MIRRQTNGLTYYTFALLDRFPELVNAVTTRHGGVSQGRYASLNFGQFVGDAPDAVAENIRRIAKVLKIRGDQLVRPRQRHTARALRVDQSGRGRIFDGYDILVTADTDVPLQMVYADCVPVLLYDPVARAIALVHSGWRGTVLGAPRSAVAALQIEFGSRPANIVAAIGPSIGPCCYEVGEDVTGAVRATFERPDQLITNSHLDLWAANRRWLHEAGVKQIECAELCTACHVAEFYSYRRERGQTGHHCAVLGLRSQSNGQEE